MSEEKKPMPSSDQHEELSCDNCGRTFKRGEPELTPLRKIRDLAQRLDPGSIVPFGECPDCGSLVYLRGLDAATAAGLRGLLHDESDALTVWELLADRFGWVGVLYRRPSAESVMGRALTDAEWTRVRQTRHWRSLAESPDSHTEMLVSFALEEAGLFAEERGEPSLGIPYAAQFSVAPGQWAIRCPICEEVIPLTERKDFESFTGREYAEHYAQRHGETS